MVENLMMSAKLASVSLRKRKVFRNEGYDVIILPITLPTKFYHMTQIIL